MWCIVGWSVTWPIVLVTLHNCSHWGMGKKFQGNGSQFNLWPQSWIKVHRLLPGIQGQSVNALAFSRISIIYHPLAIVHFVPFCLQLHVHVIVANIPSNAHVTTPLTAPALYDRSAGPQPQRISWSLAMAEFSVKSFALFMWWRMLVFPERLIPGYSTGALFWLLYKFFFESHYHSVPTVKHFCQCYWTL